MVISTGQIGIDERTGEPVQYVPPNVGPVPPTGPPPPSVSWGTAQTIAEGSSLPAGTWLVQSSAGTLDATGGSVTVLPVTITGASPP